MSELFCTGRLHIKRCITIVAIITLMALIVSCTRETILQDAVSRAINTTAQAQSYRQTGNTIYYADSDTESTESLFESEFVAPDRSHSKFNIGSDWFEGIIIGDKSYVRSSDEPQWQQSPFHSVNDKVTSVISYISTADELNVLNWLVELEQLPEEEIDGVNCSHYRGRIDVASFIKDQKSNSGGIALPLAYEELRWESDIELFIDRDNYIRQLTTEVRFPYFVESVTGDERWDTRITTIRLFDFNEVIIIEQPHID